MAEPTATGKTVLVIIETQAGRQPQLWYQDRGGFVGCAHLKPVETSNLPEAIAPWNIEAAVDYVSRQRYPQTSDLYNPIGDHHAA